MEDISTHYDSTCRNSQKDIIQFVYGEDAADGVAIEWNNLKHCFLPTTSVR